MVYLEQTAGTYYIGGKLLGLQLPVHYDHTDIRRPTDSGSTAPHLFCCVLPSPDLCSPCLLAVLQ